MAPCDNPAKRQRVSSSTSNTMITPPKSHELIDIHARMNPSARMDLALKVLDVGNLSIPGLLTHRLASAATGHFQNTFLAEGGGLETFLKELVAQYPAAENCISRAVGHDIVLKKVSAEMEFVKSYTLLSSTKVTPYSMRDWSIEIPEHLTPCLSGVLRASAVSDHAAKENKIKKTTSTVRVALLLRGEKQHTII